MSSAQTDYYQTLEVARDADGAVLKSAYRKLAMKYHPDRNPGDATCETKFKAINEAYDSRTLRSARPMTVMATRPSRKA
jgi:molecular chaperone DnaJ